MDLLTALSGAPLLLILAALALVDSTSFGTLAIPVWFLMTPGRLRTGRILLYLGTLAAFYAAVGFAVMAGAGWVVEHHAPLVSSRPVMVLGMLAGVGLFWWSFRLDSPAAKERSRAGGGRLSRWRLRAVGGGPEAAQQGTTAAGRQGSGLGPLMALALAAGLAEVATMLPYLAAIGLIMAQGPDGPASGLMLVGYCAVMMLPALVLLAGRILARPLMERPLAGLDRWFTRHGASTAAWVVGIVGVVLVLNTAPAVFAADAVSPAG